MAVMVLMVAEKLQNNKGLLSEDLNRWPYTKD